MAKNAIIDQQLTLTKVMAQGNSNINIAGSWLGGHGHDSNSPERVGA